MKRTSCAKAPMNRSASNATVVREVYPMMLKEMEKEMAVFFFGTACFQG